MSLFVFLGAFGVTEIVLILVVVLLLFGGRKIPELMKGLGEGIREFKKSSKLEEKSEEKKSEIEKIDKN